MQALLLFPHQLYFDLSAVPPGPLKVFLTEEHLFFTQYRFHKQKLAFHRSTMQQYAKHLRDRGFAVHYVEAHEPMADARTLLPYVKTLGHQQVIAFDPEDNWLRKRLEKSAQQSGMEIRFLENQLFINTADDLELYRATTQKIFQTDFYIYQRRKRNILIDANGKPAGGKWSYDAENRKKYPKQQRPPQTPAAADNPYDAEARTYVLRYFPDNPGAISGPMHYPTHPAAAQQWLRDFLERRLAGFGDYEDALVANAHVLHHSVLTPMLNVGLLKPMQVIQEAIAYAEAHAVALNDLEGFIRQILGWREFVRYVYRYHGTQQRTRNFWNFRRQIPASWYSGTTGLQPVDTAMQKLLQTGYNHHIERLMVLGNSMLLCEFDPDAVYRWFMEMYIDAYDWVMVPNVYGMSQFADGGLMCTKPYISGSNYLLKMSDFKKDETWTKIWDALFWRFLHVHRDFFRSNPRLSMLISTFDQWPENKREQYMKAAEMYLRSL